MRDMGEVAVRKRRRLPTEKERELVMLQRLVQALKKANREM